MKIEVISTKVSNTRSRSLARCYKVSWKLRINGSRIVRVTDVRDYEDSIVDCDMYDLDYHEEGLADAIYSFIDLTDYSNYEL